MSTLTFTVPQETADQLAVAASEMGVPVETLLQKIADEFLARKVEFQTATEYVLQKNAELYRRLAK
jgi:antitoxin FitA